MEAKEQTNSQIMTPDQAMMHVVARQRDEALNRAAHLEVQLAMALQDNQALREALSKHTTDQPVVSVPQNRADRRKMKG